MLSDERIRQIAESHIWRLRNIDGLVIRTDAELACDDSIRAALAEAAQSEPEEKPDFEKLESLGWQIAICAMCGTHASAIKPVQSVPVVERNQCDGCNRGLQVCDDGLHREPSGHPVMACTRNKYTHSIPATELASLREKAAMVDELQKRAERMQKALSDIAEWTDRYTTPGHPIANIARAAIVKERP